MSLATATLCRHDALLIVDVQRDFCPGGALPIAGGDEVVTPLNRWIARATEAGAPVYASRDWHPRGHLSFTESGGPWPAHCLQDSVGADFHPALRLPADTQTVTKGTRFDQDQNSAFDQTGLAMWLHRQGIKRLLVGGLALDVCVLATVLDALQAGFEVVLLADACRAVSAEGAAAAFREMQEAGAKIVRECTS